MEQSVRRPLHPLITVAAIAVIVFCAAGIAAIAGWIPNSRSDTRPAAESAVMDSATPPAPETKAPARITPPARPVAQARPAEPIAPPQPPAVQPAPPVQVAAVPSAPAVCNECATVVSVREVKQSGEGSGIGAVAGGVAGAVLGNQVGGGRGRDIATVVGAVGGAVAGHQVEKRVKSHVVYEITLEMEGGGTRTLTQAEPPSWRPGEKVRLDGDRITSRG
jgi:outer membrane lipoprotein SlyB